MEATSAAASPALSPALSTRQRFGGAGGEPLPLQEAVGSPQRLQNAVSKQMSTREAAKSKVNMC